MELEEPETGHARTIDYNSKLKMYIVDVIVILYGKNDVMSYGFGC